MAGKADTNMAAQGSLSREPLEVWNSEMKSGVDDNLQAVLVHVESYLKEGSEEDARKGLGVLLGRVESAAASLRYLRSKATILTLPGLAHSSLGVEQSELKDDSLVSQVAKNISVLSSHNPGEDTLAGTSKSHIEDGAYTRKILQSIHDVTDVLESLVTRVIAAESETSFQKKRVTISEEEIRRKKIQIETVSLRLEEMKKAILGSKTILDETTETIKRLVEDRRRDRERAVENEEELHRMKTECESLRNYINTSTTPISSERQFQTMEARLVAKSTQLEGEKAQKEVEVQKLMEENVKLTALLDKKEAQLLALNEQCKVMALNASNI
ncbi:unnamed protein product [Arabis nemorensis]|uniref:Uncharacterized protein n=1 Tax=Arabis nemorensis TaxID=586526 RepID=A0A565C8U4_9BRAS|nr:unnamed protein product [Arabis nemorensis]